MKTLIALFLAAIALMLSSNSFIQAVDHRVAAGLSGNTSAGYKILLVTVDDLSVNKKGPWPWNNNLWADITKKLDQFKPDVMAFVMTFDSLEKQAAILASQNGRVLVSGRLPGADNPWPDARNRHPGFRTGILSTSQQPWSSWYLPAQHQGVTGFAQTVLMQMNPAYIPEDILVQPDPQDAHIRHISILDLEDPALVTSPVDLVIVEVAAKGLGRMYGHGISDGWVIASAVQKGAHRTSIPDPPSRALAISLSIVLLVSLCGRAVRRRLIIMCTGAATYLLIITTGLATPLPVLPVTSLLILMAACLVAHRREPKPPPTPGPDDFICMLMCDIANASPMFNRALEEHTPLDRYLSLLKKIIAGHRGRIDNIVGDQVIAVWHDPVKPPEALVAEAMACAERIDQLSTVANFGVHMGLSAGPARPTHPDGHCTWTGPVPLKAARCEQATRDSGQVLLVCETVARLVPAHSLSSSIRLPLEKPSSRCPEGLFFRAFAKPGRLSPST
jgi:class 3 adenylate cyclase